MPIVWPECWAACRNKICWKDSHKTICFSRVIDPTPFNAKLDLCAAHADIQSIVELTRDQRPIEMRQALYGIQQFQFAKNWQSQVPISRGVLTGWVRTTSAQTLQPQ